MKHGDHRDGIAFSPFPRSPLITSERPPGSLRAGAHLARSKRLAILRRPPRDQNFAAWGNPARDEPVGPRGKQLVEARIQDTPEALLKVGTQGPERPLVAAEAHERPADSRFAGRCRD